MCVQRDRHDIALNTEWKRRNHPEVIIPGVRLIYFLINEPNSNNSHIIDFELSLLYSFPLHLQPFIYRAHWVLWTLAPRKGHLKARVIEETYY